MDERNLIAIVTATYNRKKLLTKLYKSLLEQSVQDFSWIVVDDGSVDGTKEYIHSIKNTDIDIKYMQIENGGKCRALNRVFEKYKEFELYVVVDSDDYLVPKAVENIRNIMQNYQHDYSVGAIFFRYINQETKNIISAKKQYPSDSVIISRLEHDEKYGKYDGCVAYYRRVTEKYHYPEFPNENYIGPIVLQLLMAPEFKMVFTSTIVGIAEYQENGISKTGRILRLKNPLGMILYCSLLQQSRHRWIRIKYGILAQAYRLFDKISLEELYKADVIKSVFPKYTYFFGFILAIYWGKKYRYYK